MTNFTTKQAQSLPLIRIRNKKDHILALTAINFTNRRFVSGKKATFAPILKEEGPSSRKTWRDIHAFRHIVENEQLMNEQDDAKNKNDAAAALLWLVRFAEAQLQYPVSNDDRAETTIQDKGNNSNNNNNANENNIKNSRKLKGNRTKPKKLLKNKEKSTGHQSRNRMIYTIPKLEIRSNVRPNIHHSVLSHKGTGHAIIIMNGSGKSLLIRALLYPTGTNLTTTPRPTDDRNERDNHGDGNDNNDMVTTTNVMSLYNNNPIGS